MTGSRSGSGAPGRAALHVESVQAWRGRFHGAATAAAEGGESGAAGAAGAGDGSEGLDAVVIEFGVEGGSVPPLLVPTGSVARLAAVLLDAAESEIRRITHDPAATGPTGPAWDRLRSAPRHGAAAALALGIPPSAGVYAWFCDGVPVYLGRGRAKRGLRAGIGGDQLLAESLVDPMSFRGQVAAHLDLDLIIGPDGAQRLAAEELERLNAWVSCCEVAWLTCATTEAALALDAELRAEGEPHFPRS